MANGDNSLGQRISSLESFAKNRTLHWEREQDDLARRFTEFEHRMADVVRRIEQNNSRLDKMEGAQASARRTAGWIITVLGLIVSAVVTYIAYKFPP